MEAVGGTTAAALAGIAEEPHIVPLTSGALYCVFRTSDGWLGSSHATSSDAAKTFSGWANSSFAEYLPYAPWVEQAEGALWVRSTLPSYSRLHAKHPALICHGMKSKSAL